MLIIYISGGTYSLKSTPNDRFVETLFLALLFYSPSKLIGHYNPSVRIIDLISNVMYVYNVFLLKLSSRSRRVLVGSVLAY